MCCCGRQIAAGEAPLAKRRLAAAAACFHLQHSYDKNVRAQRQAAAAAAAGRPRRWALWEGGELMTHCQ